MCGLLESISECDHEETMRSANGMDDTGEENSGTLMRAGEYQLIPGAQAQ